LEKRAGFRLGAKDVFLNITGGITVDDPAIDLAVISAILSSNADIPIEKNVCFAAEIGLAGEIRPVQRVEQRILEADKLGFSTIFVSKNNKIALIDADTLVYTTCLNCEYFEEVLPDDMYTEEERLNMMNSPQYVAEDDMEGIYSLNETIAKQQIQDRLKDILDAKGVPLVIDGDTIRRLLKGKEIELNGDGTYQRYIGGVKHTKTIMGNPM
jgi:hypothetical protein